MKEYIGLEKGEYLTLVLQHIRAGPFVAWIIKNFILDTSVVKFTCQI